MIEFNKLDFAQKLSNYHDFFRLFVDYGEIVFTDTIPTAAVSFNEKGNCISFLFNPVFWEECDEYKRIFVVCHEVGHLLYEHGRHMINSKDKPKSNIAADLVINHNLCEYFGFEKTKIAGWEKYCWVQTIFKNSIVPENENYFFYYNLVPDSLKINIDITLVDGHEGLNSIPSGFIKKILGQNENILRDVLEKTKNSKETQKMAGSNSSLESFMYKPPEIKKSRNWLLVIDKWKKFLDEMKVTSDWSRNERRYHDYLKDSKNFLPSYPENAEIKKKIELAVFLDTSGSCCSYSRLFQNAIRSIDTKYFNISSFCFDTSIVPFKISDNKGFYGGGTSYKCIHTFIEKQRLKNINYDTLFIISDGWADKVEPSEPNKWKFFITSGGSKKFIPNNSFVYDLDDYFVLDGAKK